MNGLLSFFQKGFVGDSRGHRIIFQNENGLLKEFRLRGVDHNDLTGNSFYNILPPPLEVSLARTKRIYTLRNSAYATVTIS